MTGKISKRMLIVGQVYRHFRGGVYKLVRVTNHYAGSLLEGQEGELQGISFTAACDIVPGDTVVLYGNESGKTWARSANNFNEVLNDDDREYLRFEPIQDSQF